jgi:hypothetical protein
MDRIMEHGAFEAEVRDAAFEFVDRCLQVLQWQGGADMGRPRTPAVSLDLMHIITP